MRPKKEVLVGDAAVMDFLATKYQRDMPPSPMQELVEDAIASLTDQEREIYWLRFGDMLPIRAIAEELGYTSHQIIQVKLNRILQKVREYVERGVAEGDTNSDT